MNWWLPQLLAIVIFLVLICACLRVGFDANWIWTFSPFWLPLLLILFGAALVGIMNFLAKDFAP